MHLTIIYDTYLEWNRGCGIRDQEAILRKVNYLNVSSKNVSSVVGLCSTSSRY
jgi:hypothetical protein